MKGISRTVRRRRQEAKTDYKARLSLLRSGKARVVVRKTNRYILGQVVVADKAQDKVLINVSSKDLLLQGWPAELKGSLKNLTAAYLTGYLLAVRSKKTNSAILDLGMQRNVKNSRLYAFVKGAIDGGMKIPCNEDVLPGEEEFMKNKKTNNLISKMKGGLK